MLLYSISFLFYSNLLFYFVALYSMLFYSISILFYSIFYTTVPYHNTVQAILLNLYMQDPSTQLQSNHCLALGLGLPPTSLPTKECEVTLPVLVPVPIRGVLTVTTEPLKDKTVRICEINSQALTKLSAP